MSAVIAAIALFVAGYAAFWCLLLAHTVWRHGLPPASRFKGIAVDLRTNEWVMAARDTPGRHPAGRVRR